MARAVKGFTARRASNVATRERRQRQGRTQGRGDGADEAGLRRHPRRCHRLGVGCSVGAIRPPSLHGAWRDSRCRGRLAASSPRRRPPARRRPDPTRSTPKLAHVARIVAPTVARAGNRALPAVTKVSPLAGMGRGRGPVPGPALASSSTAAAGSSVRLPERPNYGVGWISADFTRVSTTPWRILISTDSEARLTVERAGHQVASFSAVVGKPSDPDAARGLFAIDEPIRQPDRLRTRPLGALPHRPLPRPRRLRRRPRPHRHPRPRRPPPGRPPGHAASHGCIRIPNAEIRWLAAHAPPGTPVRPRGRPGAAS